MGVYSQLSTSALKELIFGLEKYQYIENVGDSLKSELKKRDLFRLYFDSDGKRFDEPALPCAKEVNFSASNNSINAKDKAEVKLYGGTDIKLAFVDGTNRLNIKFLRNSSDEFLIKVFRSNFEGLNRREMRGRSILFYNLLVDRKLDTDLFALIQPKRRPMENPKVVFYSKMTNEQLEELHSKDYSSYSRSELRQKKLVFFKVIESRNLLDKLAPSKRREREEVVDNRLFGEEDLALVVSLNNEELIERVKSNYSNLFIDRKSLRNDGRLLYVLLNKRGLLDNLFPKKLPNNINSGHKLAREIKTREEREQIGVLDDSFLISLIGGLRISKSRLKNSYSHLYGAMELRGLTDKIYVRKRNYGGVRIESAQKPRNILESSFKNTVKYTGDVVQHSSYYQKMKYLALNKPNIDSDKHEVYITNFENMLRIVSSSTSDFMVLQRARKTSRDSVNFVESRKKGIVSLLKAQIAEL